MRFFFFILLTVSACAQSVGDFSIPYKANSTGPQTLKSWAKANSTLWGTDGSGNPQSITIGSGLSLASGVLTSSGGGGVGTGTVTSVALTMPNIFSVTGSPITASGTLAASLATQSANTVFAGPTTGSAAAPTFRALVSADIPDLSGVYQPLASALTAFGELANASGVLTNNGSGALSYTATSFGGDSSSYNGQLVKFANSNGSILASTEIKIYQYPSGTNYLNLSPSQIRWFRGASDYCAIIPSEAGSACTFYFPTNPGIHTLALEDGNITGTAGGLSSTLAVTSGGTGQTSYTDGQLLIGNTTGNTLSKATLTAGSGISITNGHGTITIASTSSGGTVTSVAATVPSFLSVSGSPITTSGTLAITLSGTALPVANGGTGITAFGTGIATALGANIGSAGAPVLFNGAGGTPGSIVLTNASGTASNLTAGSASTLATGRTIAITGDLTWTSPSFNGSANVTAAGTLASTGVTAGSYTSADITVDAKGRITAAANGSGGGGGLTGFTGSLATTSPNNTVNASMLAASGGTTNQDAVIAPKGTGALIGFGIPDNTGTGGAKRGDYAVDFQGPFRNNSADIASGSSSAILGGRYNKATGSYALAFGYLSAATGSSAPIALGYQSTASASYAAAIGGIGNNASGASSSAIGGQSNTASGANAAAFGGLSNTASASYAYAFGYYSVADRYGMQAKASGQFAAAGDAQAVQFILRCKTTTNAAVEMKLDGSSTRLTIPAGKALYGTVKIIGMKSDGSVAATYTRQVAIKNAAGTTSLIGTVNTLGTDEAGSTSISITADDTNDALNISPTGITSETWRWVAVFEGVEIAYGS